MQKLKRAMPMIKFPDDLPIEIQRHRRQHQSRLNSRNRIKRIRRPALLQPNGQKLARSEAEKIPHHDREYRCLHTDIAMSIEQVSKGVALLRHSGKNHHPVYKTHHHPIYHMAWSSSARVPAEECETWDPDEEAERDEVEAEFRLVDALVAASSEFGGAIGESAHDDKSHEGANGWEGIQVAELGRGVGDRRGREYLRYNDCESNELWGGLVSELR